MTGDGVFDTLVADIAEAIEEEGALAAVLLLMASRKLATQHGLGGTVIGQWAASPSTPREHRAMRAKSSSGFGSKSSRTRQSLRATRRV